MNIFFSHSTFVIICAWVLHIEMLTKAVYLTKAVFLFIVDIIFMVPYPSGKGAVCKTAMHQFDSDRRLSYG